MSSKNDDKNMMIVRGEGSGGPCGACRFLRRKCVKGCIFAPYFLSDHLGTSHFAAVHKVFGASNASKILLRIPPQKRRDAVVSLCYEALSRVSDPVYGCVSHIFTLQQQVTDLQAQLAYIQARLSIIRCPPLLPPPILQSPTSIDLRSSLELQASDIKKSQQLAHSISEQTSFEMASNRNPEEDKHEEEDDDDDDDDDLQRLARQLVAKYLPGLKFSYGH